MNKKYQPFRNSEYCLENPVINRNHVVENERCLSKINLILLKNF